ncbi:MAG: FAD-dependent oxidoreductase [Rhodospirillaceae bacterium]|nr:FAD-dependent oxidoreductase [Rhodospirillaceae bacterium]
MPTSPSHIGVIGAGIVGVCTALYLQRDGRRVTLFDAGGPGEGTSYGNAAVIAAGAAEPVAMPGIIWRVPGMLVDPLGPLSIRWRYLPKLLPWLAQFVLASRHWRVEESAKALAALSKQSIAAYRTLTGAIGIDDMIVERGWLSVYGSDAGLAGTAEELDLLKRNGMHFEILKKAEIRQFEPSLGDQFEHAVWHKDHAHTVDNFGLVQKLAQHFLANGGKFERGRVQDFTLGPSGPTHVVTSEGRHEIDAVVIAAGAWSKPLSARLGHWVPLETERGYHVMLPHAGVAPRLPIHLGDNGFVATALNGGLRFAGTVELGGLDLPPNWKRADVLLKHGKRVFPTIDTTDRRYWMGFRPSVPDSVPVISQGARYANTFFAFGHGHLGLTYGAITGRLIADLVAGRNAALDMTPYRVDRAWN